MPRLPRNRMYRRVLRTRPGAPRYRRMAPYAKRRRIARQISNQPTFVETFRKTVDGNPEEIVANVGQVFSANITQVPQVAQYQNLYRQYRINWIKVILVPKYNSVDGSAYLQTGRGNTLPRIVYSINDTPALAPPANEAEVLEDNGCKIRTIAKMWSCSFKPRADTQALFNAGAQNIGTRQRFAQWFNFPATFPAPAPEHYGVSAFISCAVQGSDIPKFDVYYKMSFSLRDPQ